MDFPAYLSLLFLWVLFFWLYRDYRVDLFRERLFGVRDSLFDMAEAGEIGFDSPAYGILRSTINGTIQFGHRLSLLEFLAIVISTRGAYGDSLVSDYRERWDSACAGLAPEVRTKLEALRIRVHFQTIEQLVMTSALMMFTTAALLFVVAMVAVKRWCKQEAKRLFSTAKVMRLTDRLDSAAFSQMA